MVKRKPPIILASVLAIGVGFVFLLNLNSHPKDPNEAQAAPKQEEHPALDPKKQAPVSPSEMKEKLKQAAQSAGPGNTSGPPAPGMPGKAGLVPHGNGGNDPLVEKAPAPYTPKPSDTATSGQWWNDESMVKHKG
jgi:hypothetical protein